MNDISEMPTDPVKLKEWLRAGAERCKLEARRECLPQVDALIDAGWRFELPDIQDSEPWQWYWRRPPKGRNRKGRRFASTNQAFNALQRAVAILLICILASCSPTVARQEVRQHQASHSSTGQDSGILGVADETGFLVNQDWIDAYDSLLMKYGDRLTPPRKAFDRNGITKAGDQYRVSDAVLERQLVLNQRRVNEQSQ